MAKAIGQSGLTFDPQQGRNGIAKGSKCWRCVARANLATVFAKTDVVLCSMEMQVRRTTCATSAKGR